MSQILLFWKDIRNKMHALKTLRFYYVLFKFWLGILNNRSLCIIGRSIRLFPVVNLRFVRYARTTKSNKWMLKCNENIEIRLRMLSLPPQKSGPCKLVYTTFHYVLLCTFKNAIVSTTYPSESHEYCQFWTWIVMKSHEFSNSKYCGNPGNWMSRQTKMFIKQTLATLACSMPIYLWPQTSPSFTNIH